MRIKMTKTQGFLILWQLLGLGLLTYAVSNKDYVAELFGYLIFIAVFENNNNYLAQEKKEGDK